MAGDSLVGKTSVLQAFIDDTTANSSSESAEESKSAAPVDIQYKTVQMKDGAKVRLQMWDAPNVPINLKNPAVQYT
jgi:GTPase SAR1 family protein